MSYSVMVVDDEPYTRTLLRLMLNREGFEVSEAVDGADALSRVTEVAPDVMVLDAMMPGIDGFDVCKALRRVEKTADTPIIMLSSAVGKDMVERGMRAGATCFLNKPISAQTLTERIHEVLA